MKFNHDVVEAIGNTPLIRLVRASEATGCNIFIEVRKPANN